MTGLPDDPLRARLAQALGSRYRIERTLGRGGFGEVFLAVDQELSRPVAVKAPHSGVAIRAKDLRREAAAMARVGHRNVVTIHDLAFDGPTPYLLMEYVAGGDLKTWIASAPRSPTEKLRLMCGVLEGVDATHAVGLVHCDLKPRNVLLADGAPPWPKVADFGLVRRSWTADRAAGTVAYMAPEVFSHQPLDARADIYSLGVMLFELLETRLPFEVGDWTSAERAHRLEEPPSLVSEALDHRARRRLDEIVRRALSKQPCDRFPTAHALQRALEGVLSEGPIERLHDLALQDTLEANAAEPTRRDYFVVLAGRLLAAGTGPGERAARAHDAARVALEPVAARHELTTVPSLGTGGLWLVTSGGPGTKDAERALSAALEMHHRFADWRRRSAAGEDVVLRTAIHAGEVLLAGHGPTQRYLGETLEEAAALVADGLDGRVAVSEAVFDLLPPTGATAEAGGLRAWMVDPARSPLSAAPDDPFVERAYERQAIVGAWAQAACGRPQFVILEGEPGMGKSRLALEAVRNLPDAAWTWDVCADGHGEPLALFKGRIAAWIGLDAVPQRADRVQALRRYVSQLALPCDEPEWITDAETLLARLLDLALPDSGVVSDVIFAADQTEALVELLIAVVRRQAASSGGLAWVIDNLEHIDAASAHVLRRLLDGEAPLLLVGTTRQTPESADEAWRATLLRVGRRLRVWGLAPEEVEGYLAHHPEPALRALAAHGDRICQWTGGNPLLVKGLAWCLARRAESGPEPLEALGQGLADLPETLVQGATLRLWLREQLAALDRHERQLLEVCAVVSEPCPSEALAAILAGPEPDRMETIAAGLARKNLLSAALLEGAPVDGAVGYRPTMPVAIPLLRATVPERTRARIHRAWVTWCEGKPSSAHPARLAWHLEQAQQWRPALDYRVEAARRARQLAGAAAAEPHLAAAERSLEQLARAGEVQPEERMTRELELSRLWVEQALFGGKAETVVPPAEARLASASEAPPALSARLRIALAKVLSKGSDHARAISHCERALADVVGGDLPDDQRAELTARASAVRAWCSARGYEAPDLEIHLDRLLDALATLAEPDGLVAAELHRVIAQLEVQAGRPERAREHLRRALPPLKTKQLHREAALVRSLEGFLAARLDDRGAARTAYEQAARLFRRVGDADNLAYCDHALGDLDYWEGDGAAALQRLDRARRRFEALSSTWCLPETLLTLAMVHLELGPSPDRGFEAAQAALALNDLGPSPRGRAELLEAARLRLTGEKQAATALARAAIDHLGDHAGPRAMAVGFYGLILTRGGTPALAAEGRRHLASALRTLHEYGPDEDPALRHLVLRWCASAGVLPQS